MAARGERRTRAEPRSSGARTAREEPFLEGVRQVMFRDRATTARLRRLDRMERAARLWVNGVEVAADPRHSHLAQVYD